MVRIKRVFGPPPLQPAARPSGPVALQTHDTESPGLYLLPNALQAIQAHIDWGRSTEANAREQGGLLIGRAYLDPQTGEPYAVIEHALEARTTDVSAASIAFTHDTWADLMARVDRLPPPSEGPPWRIIGWYHTHPNNIGVFMSGTDRRTQQDLFPGPDRFAVVLNPQRQRWQAFRGAECVECEAVAFASEPSASEPTPTRAAADAESASLAGAVEPTMPPATAAGLPGRWGRWAVALALAMLLAWAVYLLLGRVRRGDPAA